MVIVWQQVAKLVLGKLFQDKELKARAIADLREKAKSTENELDDAAVYGLEKAWEFLPTVLFGKKL